MGFVCPRCIVSLPLETIKKRVNGAIISCVPRAICGNFGQGGCKQLSMEGEGGGAA